METPNSNRSRWTYHRLLLAVFVIISCSLSLAAKADIISIVSGNNQTGTVNTRLGSDFVVKVRTNAGANRSGVTVTWTITAGGGSLSTATSVTNLVGNARTRLTLGTIAGANRVTASAPNAGTVTFTATAVAGAAARLSLSPVNASTTAGTPVTYRATVQDRFGNTVTTATNAVTFAVSGLTGTFNPASPVAPSSGVATTSFTSTTAGSGNISASAVGLTGATTSLTVTPGPAAKLVLTPATASTAAGTAVLYSAGIQDSFGNVVTSATNAVSFTASGLTGAFTPASPVTPTAGVSTTSFTSTVAATGSINATATGLIGASSPLTVTSGPAAKLTLTPTTASTQAGTAVGYSATIQDAFGNTNTGATNAISFSVSGVAGTFTPAAPVAPSSGVATSSLSPSTVGTATVSATATGLTGATASLSVASGPAAKLALSPASASTQTGSAVTYTATIQDALGNTATAANNPISFTVTGVTGTFDRASPVDPTGGVATIGLTPTAQGAATVSATATGLASAAAALTVTAASSTTQSVFTTQTPELPDASDATAYEMGMKFRAARAGRITAVRYWKAPSDSGLHTGKIWSETGTLLASVDFTAETASGWQQQTLPSALTIQANSTYVVSVNVTTHYAFTNGGLTTSIVNGDLSSLADGNNGVFGTPGAFPASSFGNSNYFRDVVFVVDPNAPPPPPSGQSLFTSQTPLLGSASDGVPYELGMKFRSSRSGQITAIRYWRANSDAGTHTGRIWSASGTLLASVVFSNESASGWQQQALANPLPIQANTVYVVSVNIALNYPFTLSGLANAIVNGDLSSVADGNNGVHGSPGTFPTNSYQSSNYFRDVVFIADTVPSIVKVSGDNQNGTAGSVLPNPFVVSVRDANNIPMPGVPVTFSVTSGAGNVTPTNTITDGSGQASATLTLGTSGATAVTAAATGVGSTVFNAVVQNATYLENQLPGSTGWRMVNPVSTSVPEIAGYANATSVNRGGSLAFKISVSQSSQYAIDVYRLGYYAGAGGRHIASFGPIAGTTQVPCAITDPTTKLIECNWNTSFTLNVGSDWTSGLYLANLTVQGTGKQSQIWFVVRDDSSHSDLLFQSSFTTFLAYNNYGDNERHSLYYFNSTGSQRAFKVSFDRPFGQVTIDPQRYDKLTTYEHNMVRWLESQSYDVTYVTNVDVHASPGLLLQHKTFLSVGHDEYWSLEMRNAVEQARDAGVNLGFFTANAAYWRVRFEPSSSGEPNRVMACYKDPTLAVDPVAPTYLWRGPENNRPENALLGVMYVGDDPFNFYGGYDFIVANSTDPYYNNTGLTDGAHLSELVGYEWDAIVNNGFTPPGLTVLSQSAPVANGVAPYPPGLNGAISNAVRYTAPSGAKVFSTGSIQFMWGLDSDGIAPARVDPRLKQFVINVLASMGARPLTPDVGLVVP